MKRPTCIYSIAESPKIKKRLEALAAELKPSPERDSLLKKIKQLDTARHIDEWLSSPGLRAPR